MTDDEAFVRMVVDSPGDDLPRLVYADWLQERGDPRGDYLRAELDWAEPWRRGQRPDDSLQLRAMAAGLDPVWVARVSRVPLGVCCDHIPFEDCGPPRSAKDLSDYEHRHSIRLPEAYRAFILNVNGGTPDDWSVETGLYGFGHDGESALTIKSLRTLCRDHEKKKSLKAVEVWAQRRRHGIEKKYLVIADAELEEDKNDAAVLLGLSDAEFGFIFRNYHGPDEYWQDDELTFVCGSFTEFLGYFHHMIDDNQADPS